MDKQDGKYYWLIPFVFISIYVGIGVLLSSHLKFSTFPINGHQLLYAFTTNYLFWYNTSTGPLSSIFLSNFIWDGWVNLLFFIVYSLTFAMAMVESPYRYQRAWFLIIVPIIIGTLVMLVVRPLIKSTFVYGQSTVLSGFAGIVIVYIIYEIIFRRNWWKKLKENLTKKGDRFEILLGVIYVFLLIVTISMLPFFAYPTLPKLTIEIHTIGLIFGAISASMFIFLVEGHKWNKNEIGETRGVNNE